MTSLSEAYDGATGRTTPGRLYLGVALFLVGALLVIAGIVVTTTNVLRPPGGGFVTARRYGGLLGGIGVPAVLLGVLTILPAAKQTRAAALVGACISLFGVALFWHAYPCGWIGAVCRVDAMDLTLPTVGVYFFGIITTFWCLFAGVANFKTRNDPGGTVKMEVTRQGVTEVIEVPAAQARSLGGVGLLGGTPDGEVETQTNTAAATVSDGGATDSDIRSPLDDTSTSHSESDAEVMTSASPRRAPSRGDAYCGSCSHFLYVRTDDGMAPYCGYHGEVMDDMAACQEWTSQNQP